MNTLRIAVAIAVVTALTTTAAAIERNCPTGQSWSPSAGACVKKQVVKKRSPEEAYYAAIDLLEGKHGVRDDRKAVTLLASACQSKHAGSCNLLGFLYEGERLGKPDARKALGLYNQACALGDADGCVSAAEVHAKGLMGDPDPAGAIAPLARACDLGAGRGCLELAEKYSQALGVTKDESKAGELYGRALDRLGAECPKSGPSCYQLGLMFAFGNGVKVDYGKARQVFTAGCDAGSGRSCYAVGYLVQRGFGATADDQSALPYHLKACEQYDSAEGCHDAGAILSGQPGVDIARLNQLAARACALSAAQCDLQAYLFTTGRGGVHDEKQATETYLRACQAGSAVACSAAASRIAHGEGVAADGALATQIWERACETGSGDDCYQAGLAHRDGELVKEDKPRAYELMTTGCMRRSAAACEEAAEMALSGDDGTSHQDPDRALSLYDAGCTLGRGETCTRLGDVFRDGEGVKADVNRALTEYRRGCEAGDGAGCAAMAAIHVGGLGVKRDLPAGFGEHARACQLGEGGSCYVLDQLAAAATADAATRGKAAALLQTACDDAGHRVEDACQALAQSYGFGGSLVIKDGKRALALAQGSCDRGYRPSCLLAADFHQIGVGVVASQTAAVDRYTALCDQDLPEACWKLASLWLDDKPADAARLFERACEEGLAAGCTSYGFTRYTGRGADWDVAAALAAYQKACELGDEYGCENVGELHQFGIGVKIDLAQAAAAYAQSCDDDHAAGCGPLGSLVETGEGGEKRDPARAAELYRRGCDADNAEACRALAALAAKTGKGSRQEIAQLYQHAYDLAEGQAKSNPYFAYVVGVFTRDGVAVARDPAAAVTWFDRACDGRDPIGCLTAGEAHLAGIGVRRDPAKAAAMFDRACAAGVQRACDRAGSAKLPTNGKGCACRAGGERDAGGAALLVMVVACVLRRQRGVRRRA